MIPDFKNYLYLKMKIPKMVNLALRESLLPIDKQYAAYLALPNPQYKLNFLNFCMRSL